MIYRRFGRTDLDMPVISTGGMRYQQSWQDMPLDRVTAENQRNLEATIRRSIEVGINHIETARGYGSSERQLGVVLPTLPREKLIVQTKIGPEKDADQFTANFHESLDRLNLDYVDLLAIHGINDQSCIDMSFGKDGCLAAARRLQKQGKCRWVGFSTHAPLDVLMDAITRDEEHEGVRGFDYVNLHYYFILRRNWPAIQAATQRDMGVFIISPSDKGGKLYEPSPQMLELCQPLHPIVFNDLWCLSHEEIHTLSLGAARPSDYDLHLEAVELLPRAAELARPIEKRLKHAMRAAIGHESPEHGVWDLPDHRVAPGELNLPVMLWLRNLALGWGLSGYGKMRFNMLGNGGHWFPGAKASTVDDIADHELVTAAVSWPNAADLPAMLRDAVERLGGEEVKRLSQSE